MRLNSSTIVAAGVCGIFLLPCWSVAQIDPMHRNLLELGYDGSLVGQGPQGLYAYYYYNQPDFLNPNTALRLAIAPVYFDGELGFKHLLSPNTDVGLGLYGGGFGDNYYEVRQGSYLKSESFDGHGGGVSVSVYHLLNPGMLIPLNLIVRGGTKYSVYDDNSDTADRFVMPAGRVTGFIRTGFRIAGKEPVLFPDLGLELSCWYERQWRSGTRPYGFGGDRSINSAVSLYWVYAGLNYTWTNSGNHVSLAFTAGGSSGADRFSAWRIGGVLPLVSELPLMLPGYYYEELSAKDFVHFYGAYMIPLDHRHRLQLMVEAATACVSYLPGFEQREAWQTGAGVGLGFTSKREMFRVILRYGYGFNAIRHGREGSQSVGLLFQFNFDACRKRHRDG